MVARAVASPTITQYQDRCRFGVVQTAIVIPPVAETVTGKFAGIMACAQLNIADIEAYIIEAVRNDDAFSKATKIMIIRGCGSFATTQSEMKSTYYSVICLKKDLSGGR